MDMEKVRKIARQTRKWAMANREKGNFDSSLSCMCAIAAMRLFENLTKQGIDAKLALNNRRDESHCFVLVNDYVVDITATQFNQEPIFIKPVTQAKKIKMPHGRGSYWSYTKLHDSIDSLLQHLTKIKWPKYQTYLGHLDGI